MSVRQLAIKAKLEQAIQHAASTSGSCQPFLVLAVCDVTTRQSVHAAEYMIVFARARVFAYLCAPGLFVPVWYMRVCVARVSVFVCHELACMHARN